MCSLLVLVLVLVQQIHQQRTVSIPKNLYAALVSCRIIALRKEVDSMGGQQVATRGGMIHLILTLCRQFEDAFNKAVDGGKDGECPPTLVSPTLESHPFLFALSPPHCVPFFTYRSGHDPPVYDDNKGITFCEHRQLSCLPDHPQDRCKTVSLNMWLATAHVCFSNRTIRHSLSTILRRSTFAINTGLCRAARSASASCIPRWSRSKQVTNMLIMPARLVSIVLSTVPYSECCDFRI